MSIFAFVRYQGKDIKWDVEPDTPFDTQVTNLCIRFEIQNPVGYGLNIVTTPKFLSGEVCEILCCGIMCRT